MMSRFEDSEGTRSFIARIQVDAQCQHVFQYVNRRLYMGYAVLLGPACITPHIETVLHGDGHVLMPRDRPVCLAGLVEVYASNGEGAGTEDRLHEVDDSLYACEVADEVEPQQISVSHNVVGQGVIESRDEISDGRPWEEPRRNGETTAGDFSPQDRSWVPRFRCHGTEHAALAKDSDRPTP